MRKTRKCNALYVVRKWTLQIEAFTLAIVGFRSVCGQSRPILISLDRYASFATTNLKKKPQKRGSFDVQTAGLHIRRAAANSLRLIRSCLLYTHFFRYPVLSLARGSRRVIRERNEKKLKEKHGRKHATIIASRKHLAKMRVLQRNLVYVIGLPPSIAQEEVCRSFSSHLRMLCMDTIDFAKS